MGFDRGRKGERGGRGRDKRDSFGEESVPEFGGGFQERGLNFRNTFNFPKELELVAGVDYFLGAHQDVSDGQI